MFYRHCSPFAKIFKPLPKGAAVLFGVGAAMFCAPLWSASTANQPLPTHAPRFAGKADIRVEPNGVRVSGLLQQGDEQRFLDALRRADKQSVRFDNCHGGNLGVASAMAGMIRERQLSTVATGDVQSACALAFLSGVGRYVERSPLRPSVLMFHAAYDVQGKQHAEATEAVVSWLDAMTGKRFPEVARERIRATTSTQAGVFLWLPPGRPGVNDPAPSYLMLYCAGPQPQVNEQCERLGVYTLLELGIVDR